MLLQLVGLHQHSRSEGRVNDHRQAEAYRTDRQGAMPFALEQALRALKRLSSVGEHSMRACFEDLTLGAKLREITTHNHSGPHTAGTGFKFGEGRPRSAAPTNTTLECAGPGALY